MNKKQLEIFYDMACLYEYVGELNIDQTNAIDQVQKLGGHEQWDAINTLFNDDGFTNADDAFDAYFGINKANLNELADEFGFAKVGGA